MKETYEKLELEVIEFEAIDILTASEEEQCKDDCIM